MKINITIPDNKSGDWEISSFEINKDQASLFNTQQLFSGVYGRSVQPGKYKRLTYKQEVIMSNTPAEIRDHGHFIYKAKRSKKILINGLGLGVALTEILTSDIVEHVKIIENSQDVINLITPYFNDTRIEIIHENALKYKPIKNEKFDCVWHDIWAEISDENIPDMIKLHRRYGKRTKWQGSWCRNRCEQMRKEDKRDEENRKIMSSIINPPDWYADLMKEKENTKNNS